MLIASDDWLNITLHLLMSVLCLKYSSELLVYLSVTFRRKSDVKETDWMKGGRETKSAQILHARKIHDYYPRCVKWLSLFFLPVLNLWICQSRPVKQTGRKFVLKQRQRGDTSRKVCTRLRSFSFPLICAYFFFSYHQLCMQTSGRKRKKGRSGSSKGFPSLVLGFILYWFTLLCVTVKLWKEGGSFPKED